MSEDGKTSGKSRLGRALRAGKRIGKRASRIIDAQRARTVREPPESATIIFEQAKAPAVESVQPGGISLLAAAARSGIRIDHFCGGQCSCGTCRIEILEGAENLSRQEGMEQMVLGSSHVAAGNRLACQARVLGPVRVRVPEWF